MLTDQISKSFYNAGESSIHQKRTLAFVNHFILQTAEFLNNFANQCESKLMDFEIKMQKVEASLVILETKLTSIPGLESDIKPIPQVDIKPIPQVDIKPEVAPPDAPQIEIPPKESAVDTTKEDIAESDTVTPQRDPIYDKYFKMVQFGVPAQAVKLKIIQDGLDPDMLT